MIRKFLLFWADEETQDEIENAVGEFGTPFVFGLLGLSCLAAGAWILHPSVALLTVGGLLLYHRHLIVQESRNGVAPATQKQDTE